MIPLKYRLLLLVAFVTVSHVFLPLLPTEEDFLVFSRWNMFARINYGNAVDIRFDKQPNFFYRDQLAIGRFPDINLSSSYYQILILGADKLSIATKRRMKEFCRCDKLYKVTFNGSLYDHFVLRKELPLLAEEEI